MTETEAKIKIVDVKAFREKILKAGAVLVKERYLEKNTLYDFADASLRRKRQAVRIRTIGRKTFFTFKGTPQKSRKFKVREEFETEVKKGKALLKILRRLGLAPAFRYRKHRTVFRKGRLKICLDETQVGNYCELEGEKSDIVRFVKAIGAAKSELIKLDYIQLITGTGQDAGRD